MQLRRPDQHDRRASGSADPVAPPPLASATPAEPALAAQAQTAAADPDAQLLADYVAGDLGAFEALYARHERPVYRFILRSVHEARLAEDLLQDVWMRVIAHAAQFEPRARFTTWLYRIARNRLIDHWRASDADVLIGLDDNLAGDDSPTPAEVISAGPAVQPDVQVQDRAQARAYLAAVESLPPVQRETFLLHCHAELSLEQISSVTGAGMETIKSRLRYARVKLRDALSGWNGAS